MSKQTSKHPYESFIHKVQKPARYLGGELFAVKKPADSVDVRICLTFPDVYDIGMSHLGTKILYKLLNDHPQIACERAFTPWIDMEAQLRERKLPIYSLESTTALADFDVLGFSLQYEMTYTNVLTCLDLAGIPLRAVDRGEDAPLIIGGGPCATHPEAISPFFDAFLIGDAEERLPGMLLDYVADRKSGLSKQEALIRMSHKGGVYAPSLYTRTIDERSGLMCVSGTIDPRVPAVVERAFVEDISKFPFPDDSPMAAAEAIFDRLSIEIARGCTEGCRFCQAGMIYRPVRERDPNEIVDTIVRAIDKGGYDEASLTSLSTADYSCVDPLIRKVVSKLRDRKVTLGVSSLRAYGLNERLLDEIRSVRASGLTFAPEAGTQRMRDIVNKNVSEEDITTSAHRIYARGWTKMKCYYMIGLPMEEDEDVLGIVETTGRLKAVGRRYIGKRAEANASVSSHVPKPHTPFQWAAMDTVDEIKRKQNLLRQRGRELRVNVKYHDVRISVLEAIVGRGDQPVADIIEAAWRAGCRFDGWEEALQFDTWMQVIADTPEFDPTQYLGTLPVDGRLPWDHIDVGLADGFLATEWKRTLKGKLSPPCGKPAGDIIHHTNVEEADADDRKLVCYHCGVACDLNAMRSERIDFLTAMDAYDPPPEATEPAPLPRGAKGDRKPPKREGAAAPEDLIRYRVKYVKSGLIRLQGHSDMLRILPRVLRRADLPVGYSWGFNPKPVLSFSPATPLGTWSVSELMDVSLTEAIATEELLERLNAAADPGLHFLEARCLLPEERHAGSRVASADYLVALPGLTPKEVSAKAQEWMRSEEVWVPIVRKKASKTINIRSALAVARLGPPMLWPEIIGPLPDAPLLHLRIRDGVPASRPQELCTEVFGEEHLGQVVRLGFWRKDPDGVRRSPMEAPPHLLAGPVATEEAGDQPPSVL
ncbi:MAG: radical SAM family uncharacterized protein/radical SAM-linked protein [Myxococcota bacterium]|jgi:radical SAM family uncharacterized protein/radical SAM-linked protein